MIADYFTKLLQGSSFKKMHDSIININPSINYNYAMEDCRSVLELTDGKTKLSDGETKIAYGKTKLLGHNDEWVTIEARRKKKKSLPKNKNKTDVRNFMTTSLILF